MAGSVNRAILVGNLGIDPEVRNLPSGQKVANLRVATSENRLDSQSGERKEHTEWHSVSVFDQNAVEYAESYLRKGDKVYVEGRVRTRKWQDQNGGDRYTTEVVVNAIGCKLVGLSSSKQSSATGGPQHDDPEPRWASFSDEDPPF